MSPPDDGTQPSPAPAPRTWAEPLDKNAGRVDPTQPGPLAARLGIPPRKCRGCSGSVIELGASYCDACAADRKCNGCGATFASKYVTPTCEACIRAESDRRQQEWEHREAVERDRSTTALIPPLFADAAFRYSDLLAKRVKPASVIDKARAAAENPATIVIGFFGPAGAGKTTLATAAMRRLAFQRRLVGRFATTFDLARARAQARLGTGEADAIDAAADAGVLLLDECCAEQARDDSVAEVIRRRHDRMKPLVWTCGYDRAELGRRYGDGIARRLLEGAAIFELGGATNARPVNQPRAAGPLRVVPSNDKESHHG